MNLPGMTDSHVRVTPSAEKCPHCGSTAKVSRSLCMKCLLQSGLDEDELETDSLDALLAEIAVRDTEWQLGNYQILEEIGRGGMGVIYRARQRHSRRIVAVKRVLSYHADSHETLGRFQREAEAAASLDHPNILPIYEVATSNGLPFFSMKFASGGSLLESKPALRAQPRRCVALVAKVARAVQYAHAQGILHRDLKPGNILLDARGEPLVSDFGLAKWLDTTSDLTRTLTIFGTPGYIAPEQAKGERKNLKPAADVYSLGAILFDLFTGRPPFLGEHALHVIQQAAEKTAPKLRSLSPKLDRDLETICAKCLERESCMRYRSAGDLAEDLERWLEGRSIVARPVSLPTRAWRWSQRNPVLAGAAAAVLLLGSASIFIYVERTYLANALDKQSIAKRSIAVAPLLDLDLASAETSLSQSIAAPLQSQLGRFSPAQVTGLAAKSVMRCGVGTPVDFRTISTSTGARTILTGTTRTVNQKLRVSVRLIDAGSGETLLQRRFDLDRGNSPATRLSELIAAEFSSVLNGNQLLSPSSRDPALRNQIASEYLRAGHEFATRRSKTDLDNALQCFQKAIDAEPSSALARCRFVMTAITRIHSAQFSAELLAKAERLGHEAVQLNPELAEAHRALSALFYTKGDLARCLDHSMEAIEMGGPQDGPVLSVASTIKILGRPDLSLRWHEIAKHIQERPADYEFLMGDCWADLVEDDKAESIYRRASDLHPDQPEGWIGICRLRLLKGDFEAARRIYKDNWMAFSQFPFAVEMAAQVEFFSRNWREAERLYTLLAQGDPEGGAEFFGGVTFQSALGRLRQLAGDETTGRAILERSFTEQTKALQNAPEHPDVLYRLAAVESSLDKREDALQHLAAARKAGRLDYRSLHLDPRFDQVRDDRRYKEIFEAMATRVASLRRSQSTESK